MLQWRNHRVIWALTCSKLWNPGAAYLYTAVAELLPEGGAESSSRIIDAYRQTFGIRTVEVSGTTFLINGKPFCFANAVRRGKIGVVGASGTGTQEVTVQIHKLGEGLSHLPDVTPEAHPTPALASILRMNRSFTGLPCLTGENVCVSDDYDGQIAALAAAIDRAERYVHVEAYIVSWDEVTDPVFRAMGRALERVDMLVRMLLSPSGERSSSPTWLSRFSPSPPPSPDTAPPTGMTALPKPSLAASRSRAAETETGRMAPESAISPK